jgi:Transposase DDE domain
MWGLIIDSTGIKVYGEGEWKVRQHGLSKLRTWRKLHLALDEGSGEILAAVVSTNDWGDSEILPDWVEQLRDTSTKFRVMEPMTPSQSAERGQSSRPVTMP